MGRRRNRINRIGHVVHLKAIVGIQLRLISFYAFVFFELLLNRYIVFVFSPPHRLAFYK